MIPYQRDRVARCHYYSQPLGGNRSGLRLTLALSQTIPLRTLQQRSLVGYHVPQPKTNSTATYSNAMSNPLVVRPDLDSLSIPSRITPSPLTVAGDGDRLGLDEVSRMVTSDLTNGQECPLTSAGRMPSGGSQCLPKDGTDSRL